MLTGSLCCPFSAVAPSPTSGTPRMTRSNSIPTHEPSFELYQASPLGSTLSLAERPKSMIRSGSFRDRDAADDGETLRFDLNHLHFLHITVGEVLEIKYAFINDKQNRTQDTHHKLCVFNFYSICPVSHEYLAPL